jgi:hypothetical protein
LIESCNVSLLRTIFKVLGIVFYNESDSFIAVDEQAMLLSRMSLSDQGI